MFIILHIQYIYSKAKHNVCDHTDAANYNRLEIKSYFNPLYYEKNPGVIQHCSTCSVSYGISAEAYKVSSKNPVYACINNVKKNCTFSLCKNCYNKIVLNEDNAKSSKRAKR